MLTIVDTPGFGTCANDAKVRETIQKTVDRVSKKVDVIFILVFLPCGDLDEQNEMSVYKELTTIFGNATLKSKSIAVLSYADNVEQSSSSIFSAVDQYLNDDNTTLLHFIEKNHGNRYLAVYNQSNNTTYKQEVSACRSTQGDLSYPLPKPLKSCVQICVVDCFCKDGYYLNTKGNCAEPEQCCTGNNEEYTTCGTACSATCDNKPEMCTNQCVSGCFCKSEYVRKDNNSNSPCVKRSEYLIKGK
ncbi:unnamed protein product [Rotaria socialis]|uniref:AIG1-type G domain-containing protein n=1 Tax=Rotaria socialis TaxID=392032 RepID=A0A817W0Y9_9BILA|nr:unnamed protein product [Rotaria socialis]